LTEDKDFGEIIHRLRRPSRGIILLRFDTNERTATCPRLKLLISSEHERLAGQFTVLEVDKVRIRPLTS
jgi:hypothetical protein